MGVHRQLLPTRQHGLCRRPVITDSVYGALGRNKDKAASVFPTTQLDMVETPLQQYGQSLASARLSWCRQYSMPARHGHRQTKSATTGGVPSAAYPADIGVFIAWPREQWGLDAEVWTAACVWHGENTETEISWSHAEPDSEQTSKRSYCKAFVVRYCVWYCYTCWSILLQYSIAILFFYTDSHTITHFAITYSTIAAEYFEMMAFPRLAKWCDMNFDILCELWDINVVGLHWTLT